MSFEHEQKIIEVMEEEIMIRDGSKSWIMIVRPMSTTTWRTEKLSQMEVPGSSGECIIGEG